MNPKQAIKKIKESYPPDIVSISYIEMIDALNLAVQSLEKQIAKKPTGMSITHEGRVANCPRCKKFITEQLSQNGCFYCLQRLDWGAK